MNTTFNSIQVKMNGHMARWSALNRPMLLSKNTRVGRLSELNAKSTWTSQAIDDLLDYEVEYGTTEETHQLRIEIETDLAVWGVDTAKCTHLRKLLNQ